MLEGDTSAEPEIGPLCSPVMERASETAMATALFRAAHQLLDERPLLLDDPVAVGLIPNASERALRAQRRTHGLE